MKTQFETSKSVSPTHYGCVVCVEENDFTQYSRDKVFICGNWVFCSKHNPDFKGKEV